MSMRNLLKATPETGTPTTYKKKLCAYFWPKAMYPTACDCWCDKVSHLGVPTLRAAEHAVNFHEFFTMNKLLWNQCENMEMVMVTI